jgi:hypothetical protein
MTLAGGTGGADGHHIPGYGEATAAILTMFLPVPFG